MGLLSIGPLFYPQKQPWRGPGRLSAACLCENCSLLSIKQTLNPLQATGGGGGAGVEGRDRSSGDPLRAVRTPRHSMSRSQGKQRGLWRWEEGGGEKALADFPTLLPPRSQGKKGKGHSESRGERLTAGRAELQNERSRLDTGTRPVHLWLTDR